MATPAPALATDTDKKADEKPAAETAKKEELDDINELWNL